MDKIRLNQQTAVVLINGFTTLDNDFETIMPFFNRIKELLIIDLPGDGQQGQAQEFEDFQSWLSRYSERIVAMKSQTKHLLIIAFSNGAVPATYFASQIGCDRLVLISPVFNYSTFDQSAAHIMNMVKSMVVSKGKADPIGALKSFSNIKTFLKNPIQNLGALTRVRLGPLMKPQNILWFPIVSLFDEELKQVDEVGAKVGQYIVNKRMGNIEDVVFTEEPTLTEEKVVSSTKDDTDKSRLLERMVKEVSKIIPTDFKNVTSKSVMNILQLLSYCDHYFTPCYVPLRIYIGYEDGVIANTNYHHVLERITHPQKNILVFHTDEHNLLGSRYYKQVAADIYDFITQPLMTLE